MEHERGRTTGLILFAMVSGVAGRPVPCPPIFYPLYPLTGSQGWGVVLVDKSPELTHSTNNHSRSHLEKPVVSQLSTVCRKKKSLDCRRKPEKNPGKHENMQTPHKKTQDLLAVRCDNGTMVSLYYISLVYLLKVCLWSLNYSLQQIHLIYQHLHQSSLFPNVMPSFTAPTD